MGTCLSVDDSSDEEIGCGRSSRVKRNQRKRHVMEVLAAEAKSNELLYRIPGRMCGNGASSSACIFTQQGRKGTNQDAMIVWENFASRTDTTFCGVFDGHGPYGHLVARKVRDSLPSKLSALCKSQAREGMNPLSASGQEGKKVTQEVAEAEPSAELSTDGEHQKLFTAWKNCFLKSYHAMDKELKMHPTIDCFCSGTTAVTMLLQGQNLVIANVGDSRAVLGTLTDDNSKVEAVQLTVDLKPNLPLEAERIKRCKGRVFALEDEPEVARVWLPHDDSPGLAMARAFGDFCLKDFGLIAVPEVTYTRLTERDQFIVLASDGVWDVLSNKEVVETIWEAPTRTTAARALVETAVRAWRLKYPTSKVDDCAVVCLYLSKQQRQAPTISTATEAGDVEQASEIAEALRPAEFQRSDTLRSGNATASENSTQHTSPSTAEFQRADVLDSGSQATAHGSTEQPSDSAAVEAPVVAEEAQSEITVLSEAGEEEEGKAGAAGIVERSTSRRSLAECLSVADEDEWSALEGIARVNSLLNLPRFLVGDRRGSASTSRARPSAANVKRKR